MEGETKEKQTKAPREPRERKPRDPNEVREPRPPREAREARPPREAREARGPRAPGAAGADGAPKRKGPTFDGSKEEKQIDALVVKRTGLIEKIKTVTKKGPGSDLSQQVNTLRNSLTEKKAQTTALNEKKDVIKTQVTGIRAQMQELILQFQGIKDNLPIKRKTSSNAELIAINIAAIDQNINKMETDEMNNATTIAEEKDIMGRIAVAKGTKRLIESIQLLEDAIQQKRVQLDALNEEFDTINAPLKVLQQEKEAIFQELQTKKALLDQERETAKASYDSIPVISGQIEAINRQIDDLKAQRTVRYGEWRLQQDQKREKDHQDYLARKKAREEADAARQARLDQSDEEKFVVTPYEKEIVDCDRTLAYLATAGSSKAPATIRHTINSLGLFDLISISPPLTKAAVPNTIIAVNEKKIYFIEAQKAETKRREEAVAAKVAARAAAAAAAAAGSSSSSSSSAEAPVAAAAAAEAPVAAPAEAEAEVAPVVAEAAVETPAAEAAPADAPQDA